MAEAWPRVPLPARGARVAVLGPTSHDVHAAQRRLLGTVLYCGKTKFASGNWVGVMLDEPVGRSDGSVQNVRYFSCPPRHGVFTRPDAVKVLKGYASDHPAAAMDEAHREPGALRSRDLQATAAPLGAARVGSPAARSAAASPGPRSGSPGRSPLGLESPARSPREERPLPEGAAPPLAAASRRGAQSEIESLQSELQEEEQTRRALQEALASAWNSLLQARHFRKAGKESELKAVRDELHTLHEEELRAFAEAEGRWEEVRSELRSSRAEMAVLRTGFSRAEGAESLEELLRVLARRSAEAEAASEEGASPDVQRGKRLKALRTGDLRSYCATVQEKRITSPAALTSGAPDLQAAAEFRASKARLREKISEESATARFWIRETEVLLAQLAGPPQR